MTITLRDRTAETVSVYFQRTRVPAIRQMLPQKAQTVEEALADFLETQKPGAGSFGRTIYADGQYIGDVWCYCIDPAGDPQAMVSYCVFEQGLWGRGAATEALRLFLAEIRERFGAERVGAFTFAANAGSIRVLEKNGFRLQESFVEDGVESVYYQLPMKNLYTGFKGRNNSSYRLVSAMPEDRYFLTNSFSGVQRDIAAIQKSYDAVWMFGLDKSLLNTVRVETCAEETGHILRTNADIATLSRRLDSQGIPYSVSAHPTHYLCNAAYYHMLQKMTCPVLLIHIPSQKNMTDALFSQLLAAFTDDTCII